MRTLVIVFLALALASCANPINQHTAAKYHGWGSEAERAGDYTLAERNYERSLVNARLGHSPDASLSMAMYNLGRVKGYLCKYDEAEHLLAEALELEEKVTGPDSGITTMRLFELARLHFDRERYAASLPYFSRAIPVVRKLGVESSDPIGLADVLDQYAIALGKTGHSAEGADRKREADALRAKNHGKIAGFKPISYNQPCQTKLPNRSIPPTDQNQPAAN
ncbi:MAG: tetratricopeptide repeat protein [Nitrospira sp.]|nr:tetratricopeptide repeat protein [Nitrospira sp.]